MSNYAQVLTEDRRLVILRALAELPSYKSNSSILCTLLERWGHSPSRDQVKTDLRWLEEQGLLKVEEVESVLLATYGNPPRTSTAACRMSRHSTSGP